MRGNRGIFLLQMTGLNIAVFAVLLALAQLTPWVWYIQTSLIIAVALILLGLYSPWIWNGFFAAALYILHTFILVFLIPDDRSFWVIIFNRFGLIMAYFMAAVYLYWRRRITKAFLISEARYRTLFEQSQDAVFIITPKGVILDVNDAALRMFGYDRQDMDTLDARKNFVDREIRRHLANLIKNEGAVIEYPLQLRKKDGEILDCLLSSMVQRSKNNRIIAYHVIIRDITDKKRSDEALQKAHAEVKILKNRLQAENIYLQEEIKLEHNFDQIISRSASLKKLLHKVEQVAATDSTVLILGETGTGKELLARAVHNLSLRNDRPLVKVNCAVLSANLIESELFGHEKGAFTGAIAQKPGRFELAHGGTIFLDEIGELPLELQARFLRVLQEGELERLGSVKTIHVDVRVIAATNRELDQEIKQGRFREDLFYRLNVFPITLPPLKDRIEDIPLLVDHFIKKYNAKTGKDIRTVPQGVMDIFQAYHWPGNIRELENIIERAIILSPGNVLKLDELLSKSSPASAGTNSIVTLTEHEKQHILAALNQTGWRVSGEHGAAKLLDIKPTTLEARMHKLGINRQL
jgi:PAS domain S-box-containing protein